MAKSWHLSDDWLNYTFIGTAIPWAANTHMYVALHSADPMANIATGTQETNEITYTGYTRLAVPRDGVTWVNDGAAISTIVDLYFPINTGTSEPTVSHVSIGTASTGAGEILYSKALTTPVDILQYTKPWFEAGTLEIQDA